MENTFFQRKKMTIIIFWIVYSLINNHDFSDEIYWGHVSLHHR
jgi:hypothetical protein